MVARLPPKEEARVRFPLAAPPDHKTASDDPGRFLAPYSSVSGPAWRRLSASSGLFFQGRGSRVRVPFPAPTATNPEGSAERPSPCARIRRAALASAASLADP